MTICLKILLVVLFFSYSAFSFSDLNYIKNELIVKFNAQNMLAINSLTGDNIPLFDSLNLKFNAQSIDLTGNKKLRNTYLITFEDEQEILDLVEIYFETGLFEFVEPNYIGFMSGETSIQSTFPDDSLFSRQYGLYNDGTFTKLDSKVDADIDMELAWDIEKGDSSIIVAVLDAGTKLDHPEFSGRLWENKSETINDKDDDNNGFVDDIYGWDFVNNDNNPVDDNGHGTNVAGIIVANPNNGIGYAGVDWKCKLMTCKILDNNSRGLFSWFTEAIYYAVDNGARVINMSVVGRANSQSLREATEYAYSKGSVIVASMANENNDVIYYPAGFEHTIAVGSTDANDHRSNPFFWSTSSGSNFGNHIDVVAPGNYIYGLSYKSDINYNSRWGGTSQATPLVSGICTLLFAQNKDITPDEIRNIIRSTSEDEVGDPIEDRPGFDMFYGYGRVNAYGALSYSISSVKQGKNLDITIYPNPSKSIINIDCKYEIQGVKIKDLLGKEYELRNSRENLRNNFIDIKDLPNGVYWLSLIGPNKTEVHTKQIIKY